LTVAVQVFFQTLFGVGFRKSLLADSKLAAAFSLARVRAEISLKVSRRRCRDKGAGNFGFGRCFFGKLRNRGLPRKWRGSL
jgi:hypothetical protein